MAADKKLSGAGLRGQVAGQTTLCTVGTQGSGLNYRGYDVDDLADNCICLLYTSPSPRDAQ